MKHFPFHIRLTVVALGWWEKFVATFHARAL